MTGGKGERADGQRARCVKREGLLLTHGDHCRPSSERVAEGHVTGSGLISVEAFTELAGKRDQPPRSLSGKWIVLLPDETSPFILLQQGDKTAISQYVENKECEGLGAP